jgi:hypothetical protein
MAKNYGGGTEQSAPARKKYAYKICRGAWNEREHRYDGCGKLFTTDSFINECPDCGTTLCRVRLDGPPEKPVARIVFEKCAKCAHSLRARKCLGGKPAKAEHCLSCKCRECCRKQNELADAMIKGEYPLSEWARDCAREREEGRGPAAGKTAAEKRPAEKLMEQAAAVKLTAGGDEIPF